MPVEFTEFYQKQNGGVPQKDWWDSGDDYEPVRVKRFKSVAAKGDQDASESKYLGGCYASMIARDVIPQTLLPFANDDGGNFFCLDLIDGNICFYSTDSFDSDQDAVTNQARAYRWLAESFTKFIEGLKDESELDY